MIAPSHRRSTLLPGQPAREPASHVLADLADATAAVHASLLRWEPASSCFTVCSAVGVPLLAPGMALTGDDPDDLLVEDEGGVPLAPPVLSLIAGAAGGEDTFVAPLRTEERALEGLVFLCWSDAAAGPSDLDLMAAVERHRPPLQAALEAALTAPIVVAHEDELIAHGIARMIEGGYLSAVRTCTTRAGLHRALMADGASIVLCSDGLAPKEPLNAVVDGIRDRARGAGLILLTQTASPAATAAARATHADGLAALADGATELLLVLGAVRRGQKMLPGDAPPDDPWPGTGPSRSRSAGSGT